MSFKITNQSENCKYYVLIYYYILFSPGISIVKSVNSYN